MLVFNFPRRLHWSYLFNVLAWEEMNPLTCGGLCGQYCLLILKLKYSKHIFLRGKTCSITPPSNKSLAIEEKRLKEKNHTQHWELKRSQKKLVASVNVESSTLLVTSFGKAEHTGRCLVPNPPCSLIPWNTQRKSRTDDSSRLQRRRNPFLPSTRVTSWRKFGTNIWTRPR